MLPEHLGGVTRRRVNSPSTNTSRLFGSEAVGVLGARRPRVSERFSVLDLLALFADYSTYWAGRSGMAAVSQQAHTDILKLSK
jgi:hypothetical protein